MKLNEIASKDRQEIEKFLRRWTDRGSKGYEPLKNYTINEDGTIDVDGDVHVSAHLLGLGKLPYYIKFGIVSETFGWMGSTVQSLRGSPEQCGNFFVDYAVNVNTFEHFPKIINKKLTMYHDGLDTFCGLSERVKHIGEEIEFSQKAIKSGGIGLILTGLPKLKYGGFTPPWKIISKYMGKPDQIFECQNELIEAGFEEYAQL